MPAVGKRRTGPATDSTCVGTSLITSLEFLLERDFFVEWVVPVEMSQAAGISGSHRFAIQDGFGQLGNKFRKFVDVIGSETAYVTNLKRKIGPAFAIKIGGLPNHVTQCEKLVDPILTLGKFMPGIHKIGGKMLCSFMLLGQLIVLNDLPGNLSGILSIVKVAVIAISKIAIV